MSLASQPPQLSRRARVLVVDDERVNRTVASQLCMMFGADVHCASSAIEAVEACAYGVYDLILMDIRMPEIDGVEATARIRGLGGGAAELPVLALTADVSRDLEARCANVGIAVVLQKPLRAAELFRAVQNALDTAFLSNLLGQHAA